ncbi:unnamed protein product [Closterium sp. NIES-65]|nr:unnamed protein product [Closterium sp. NIES-65]
MCGLHGPPHPTIPQSPPSLLHLPSSCVFSLTCYPQRESIGADTRTGEKAGAGDVINSLNVGDLTVGGVTVAVRLAIHMPTHSRASRSSQQGDDGAAAAAAAAAGAAGAVGGGGGGGGNNGADSDGFAGSEAADMEYGSVVEYGLMVLVLHGDEKRQWQPHEVEMVEAVADQVAIALSHAAALEESQRRREEMAEQNAAMQVARVRAEEAIQARNDFLSVMNHERREEMAEQNAALQVARIRAEEAIQARNDFLSVMNHEMRSPLHTILALSSLMEEDDLTDEQGPMVATLTRSASMLTSLISDVIGVAQRQEINLVLEHRPFDLRRMLHDAASLAWPMMRAKGLSFSVVIAREVPRHVVKREECRVMPSGAVWCSSREVPQHVVGDERRLLRMVLHIIRHAIDSTDESQSQTQEGRSPGMLSHPFHPAPPSLFPTSLTSSIPSSPLLPSPLLTDLTSGPYLPSGPCTSANHSHRLRRGGVKQALLHRFEEAREREQLLKGQAIEGMKALGQDPSNVGIGCFYLGRRRVGWGAHTTGSVGRPATRAPTAEPHTPSLLHRLPHPLSPDPLASHPLASHPMVSHPLTRPLPDTTSRLRDTTSRDTVPSAQSHLPQSDPGDASAAAAVEVSAALAAIEAPQRSAAEDLREAEAAEAERERLARISEQFVAPSCAICQKLLLLMDGHYWNATSLLIPALLLRFPCGYCLVEDNVANRIATHQLLLSLHCHVTLAASTQECLSILSGSRKSPSASPIADIVLLDICMPDVDGLEAARCIHKMFRRAGIQVQKKKEEEAKREKELNELFRVAITQPKVPPGVDPKSIVCEFFRHGQCSKGFKCKFSHDLSVERKGEKIDLYSDQRDEEGKGEAGLGDERGGGGGLGGSVGKRERECDQAKLWQVVAFKSFLCLSWLMHISVPCAPVPLHAAACVSVRADRMEDWDHVKLEQVVASKRSPYKMEDWDQAKLEQVVASKGAEYKNANKPTEIVRQLGVVESGRDGERWVCKHFLEAVEKKQYGWFWVCPNGGKDCMYRHVLTPSSSPLHILCILPIVSPLPPTPPCFPPSPPLSPLIPPIPPSPPMQVCKHFLEAEEKKQYGWFWVCKHFLEAVEKKQYGWFWVCPNGGKDCMYRHALPPGYVLKSQMKALLEEEQANKLTVEEMIENERKMTASHTLLTTEIFMEWKRKQKKQIVSNSTPLHILPLSLNIYAPLSLLHLACAAQDDSESHTADERDLHGVEAQEADRVQTRPLVTSSFSLPPSPPFAAQDDSKPHAADDRDLHEWKRKKQEVKDAEQAAKKAARAKEDRMSGREQFLSDASLFVDDDAACDAYERVEEAAQLPLLLVQASEPLIRPLSLPSFPPLCSGRELFLSDASLFVDDDAACDAYERVEEEEGAAAPPVATPGESSSGGGGAGPSSSGAAGGLALTEEDEMLLAEDDDELAPEELEELEAELAKTSIS